jgi:membrane protease YdiL (CAAX protease family)
MLGAVVVLAAFALTVAYLGVGLRLIDPKTFPTHPMPAGLYVLAASYLPLLAYFAMAVPWASGQSWRQMGMDPPNQQSLLLALVVAAALVLLEWAVAAIEARTYLGAREAGSFLAFGHGATYVAVYLTATVLLGPIAEEIGFRVLLFGTLRRMMSTTAAAVISSVIFALAHMSVATLLVLTVAGFAFAQVYARSKSLWTAVVAHAAFNIGGILFALQG